MLGNEGYYYWSIIFVTNILLLSGFIGYKNYFRNCWDKKKIVDVWIFSVIAVAYGLGYSAFPREMDVPSLISHSYCEMNGTITEITDSWVTGVKSIKVLDDETGQEIHFKRVAPKKKEPGDDVRIIYLKNTKAGMIIKWYDLYPEEDRSFLGIVTIVYLLGSIIFYIIYHKYMACLFRYKDDYFIPIYLTQLKVVEIVVACVRVQMALVIGAAIKGLYHNSWDLYWSILLVLDYLGVFLLFYYRSHELVIRGDHYYFSGARKRVEGEVKEGEKNIGNAELWNKLVGKYSGR